MKTNEWHTVIAFGLLAGGLAMYDAKLATEMVLLAGVVIVVRNATKIEGSAQKLLGDVTL